MKFRLFPGPAATQSLHIHVVRTAAGSDALCEYGRISARVLGPVKGAHDQVAPLETQ